MNSPVAPELQESMALISIYWKSILHITTVSVSFFIGLSDIFLFSCQAVRYVVLAWRLFQI